MFKTPLRIAIFVFVAALIIGVIVFFAADAFPPGARTSFEKGQVAGKLLGPPALLLGVGAYFVARWKKQRAERGDGQRKTPSPR